MTREFRREGPLPLAIIGIMQLRAMLQLAERWRQPWMGPLTPWHTKRLRALRAELERRTPALTAREQRNEVTP